MSLLAAWGGDLTLFKVEVIMVKSVDYLCKVLKPSEEIASRVEMFNAA